MAGLPTVMEGKGIVESTLVQNKSMLLEAMDSQWFVFLFLKCILAVNCSVRVLSANDWLCEW